MIHPYMGTLLGTKRDQMLHTIPFMWHSGKRKTNDWSAEKKEGNGYLQRRNMKEFFGYNNFLCIMNCRVNIILCICQIS